LIVDAESECFIDSVDVLVLQAYHVKGQFGTATHDFTSNGRIIEQTTYSQY